MSKKTYVSQVVLAWIFFLDLMSAGEAKSHNVGMKGLH